jgi:succinate-semialdehyde dehydrogenase/glutarate-semialdehyde dehydrogenase
MSSKINQPFALLFTLSYFIEKVYNRKKRNSALGHLSLNDGGRIMTIRAVNPTTGETIKEYEEMTPKEARGAIEKSHQAFLGWRRTSFAERARLMKKAAQILRDKAEDYARLMAEEMGKPLKSGRSEAEKCAWGCDYYADNAEKFLQPEVIDTDSSKSFVTFQPLGVILAIMPWNFPFWQVFRFAAPALMAGNAALLKHASNVPGCALAIEDIFHKADFPANIFRTLLIGSNQVEAIIQNPLVKAATLTGPRAGWQRSLHHFGRRRP